VSFAILQLFVLSVNHYETYIDVYLEKTMTILCMTVTCTQVSSH